MSGSLSSYRPTVEEAKVVYDMLADQFRGINIPVGSFARKSGQLKERIGDIDMVLCPYSTADAEHNNTVLSALFGQHKNGAPKTMGVIGRIQVDVFLTDRQAVGATYLFYSVPRQIQLALRCIAAARGLRFGPKGVFDRNTGLLIPTFLEAEVYELLGVNEFSTEELDAGASYVYSEALNKEKK